MTFRFIYFDIDDTLLNHRQAERAALQVVRSAMPALQTVSIESLWATYGRINRDLWERYGRGEINRPDLQHLRFYLTLRELELPETAQADMSRLYMSHYRRLWSWMPGAQEALATCAARWPVGFLTNGFAEVQRAKSEKFGLLQYSDIFVISEEVGCMKPSACIFAHAAELAGVPAGEILYVGDSYSSDIQGAKQAGWQTAWLADPKESDPQGAADIRASNLTDLRQLVAD